MNKLMAKLLATLVISILALPGIGIAQDGDCIPAIEKSLRDTGSYERGLRRQCIGDAKGDEQSSRLVRSVQGALADESVGAVEQISGVIDALQILISATESRSTSGQLQTQWQQLGDRLKIELAIVQSAAASSDVTTGPPFMLRGDFEVDGTGFTMVLGDFAVYKGVEDSCPPVSDLGDGPIPVAIISCPSFVDRIDLLRALRLSENVASYSTATNLIAHVKDSKQALDRWDAYWNDAHFQWWWEVLLNGSRMDNQGLCQTNEKAVRVGFCEVPSSQWIFLHPDAAFQWVDGSESTEDLHVSGIIEIFGRNRWKWSGSEITKAFGWSIVASYTSLSGQDNWGYGGMIHWRNEYSLGVTDTDGELGIFLTVNLSDLLFERREKYEGYLQTLNKKDFRSVIFD